MRAIAYVECDQEPWHQFSGNPKKPFMNPDSSDYGIMQINEYYHSLHTWEGLDCTGCRVSCSWPTIAWNWALNIGNGVAYYDHLDVHFSAEQRQWSAGQQLNLRTYAYHKTNCAGKTYAQIMAEPYVQRVIAVEHDRRWDQ